ncbi:MAG: glycerate kinase [Prevotella sp.]|nr:glycerate kinase [Prevotella sp.]
MVSNKKYVAAFDSLKGCLSSAEANRAAARGIICLDAAALVVQATMSDGGEGWLDAVAGATGARLIYTDAHDALMRPRRCCYAVSGLTAFVEVAQVVGLTLIAPSERDAVGATTYGLGELLADAARRGCTDVVIGLGGTATTDVGEGMMAALREAGMVETLSRCRVTGATDVESPLLGPTGAARMFAPQKGATPAQVESLERRAAATAQHYRQTTGRDCSLLPGAGAAGGLGYALMQHLGATLRPGAELLFDLTDFDRQIAGARLVVTGEGSSDAQTLMGKLPFRVMQRARRQGIPTLLMAGRIADRDALLAAGFADIVCINPPELPLAVALRPDVAAANIAAAVARLPWL